MPDKQIVNETWAEYLISAGIDWFEFSDRVILSGQTEIHQSKNIITQRSYCVNDPKNKMFGYTSKKTAVFRFKKHKLYA